MPVIEYGRKTVKLRRAGGSRSVVLPKDWLDRLGAGDQVDLVESDMGILIQPTRQEAHSLEDEPEFAQFLNFLVEKARNDPDSLVNVAELIKGDEELFGDVPID